MRRRNLNLWLCTIFWLAGWTLPALAVAQGASRADQSENPTSLLDRGIDLLTGPGSDEEALAVFLEIAERSDRPASAWLWAAVAAERLGRFEEAGAYKAKALAPAPPRLTATAVTPAATIAAPATPSAPAPSPAAPPATQRPAPAAQPAPTPPPVTPAEEPARPEAEAATKAPPAEEKKADTQGTGAGAQSAGEAKSGDADEGEAGEVKPQTEEAEKVDAFQHFFGRRPKPEPKEEAEASPPPPAG